jgi:hypothetical protein
VISYSVSDYFGLHSLAILTHVLTDCPVWGGSHCMIEPTDGYLWVFQLDHTEWGALFGPQAWQKLTELRNALTDEHGRRALPGGGFTQTCPSGGDHTSGHYPSVPPTSKLGKAFIDADTNEDGLITCSRGPYRHSDSVYYTSLVITHMTCTERCLNDSTAHG